MKRSILYFELRRLFVSRVFLLLVLLLSIINAIKIYGTYLENEQLHKLIEANVNVRDAYEKLNEQFEGELTNEKIKHFMDNYYQPIIKQVADFTVSTNCASDVELTGNPYMDKNLVSQFFYTPMQYNYLFAFQSADTAERAEYLETHAQDNYQREQYARIKERFNGRSINEFHHVDNFEWYFSHTFSTFLLLFFCLYGLSRIFLSHEHLDMERLLITCLRGGLPRIRAKLIALSIFMIALTVYFSILDTIVFSMVFPSMQNWNMPLFSLSSCANTPLNISFWQAALLSLTYKLIGVLMLSVFLILLVERVRSVFIPFIGISLIMVALTLVSDLSIGRHQCYIRLINPMTYLNCNINLFSSAEFMPLFGKPLFVYEAAFFIAILSSIILIALVFLFCRRNLWSKDALIPCVRHFQSLKTRFGVLRGGTF